MFTEIISLMAAGLDPLGLLARAMHESGSGPTAGRCGKNQTRSIAPNATSDAQVREVRALASIPRRGANLGSAN